MKEGKQEEQSGNTQNLDSQGQEEKPDRLPASEVPKPTPAEALKQQPPEMVPPESTDTAIHNVKNGDTLWDISEKYTGTGFNYRRLAKENEIANPDLIFPEQKVRVSRKQEIKNWLSIDNQFKLAYLVGKVP